MKRILYLLCLLTVACSTAHAQHHVSFNPQPFQEVVAPIRLIGTGDINGDGRIDVVGASSMQAGSTLTILLWLQGNDGKLLPVQPFHHPAPAFKTLSSLLVADLHKDGKNEVVVGLSNTLYIYSWQANALVRTDSFITLKASTTSTLLVPADFDGDGLTDIAATFDNSDSMTVLFQNASSAQQWEVKRFALLHGSWNDASAGQFGSLEQTALVGVKAMSGSIIITTFDAARNLQGQTQLHMPPGQSSISSATIVKKEDPAKNEIWVTNGSWTPNSRIAVWRGLHTTPDTIFTVHNAPEAIMAANLDCDKDDEVVVLHFRGDQATVFADNGEQPQRFTTRSYFHPQSLSLGDVNNDGFKDICIANIDTMVVFYNTTPWCFGTAVAETPKAGLELRISPNPANNYIEVSAITPGALRIWNTAGQALYTGPLAQTSHIDVSAWAQGLYFIELQTDKGESQRTKFVK